MSVGVPIFFPPNTDMISYNMTETQKKQNLHRMQKKTEGIVTNMIASPLFFTDLLGQPG